jgi:hypothetical protein
MIMQLTAVDGMGLTASNLRGSPPVDGLGLTASNLRGSPAVDEAWKQHHNQGEQNKGESGVKEHFSDS